MLSITTVNMPASAVQGTTVVLQVGLRLDNLQPLHWVGVRGELDGLPLADADPYWMQIPGDGNVYFTSLHFTMPAHDAVVYLTPFYVDPDIGDVVDEATGTVTVALAGGAPNEFSNLVAQYA